MYIKILTQVLIIGLLSSCSTKWADFFSSSDETGKRNEELIKSFEVEDNVLEKFKEKEVAVEEEVEGSSDDKAITSDSKEKKTNSEKTKKVTQVKKTKVKKAVKAPVKLKVQKKPTDSYPADYPKELKDIDKKTLKYWGKLKPTLFEGEEVYMDINYMGVSTGKIALSTRPSTKLGDKEVFHLHARVKTSRYYSYLYELDDNVDSYLSVDKFLPVKFSLIQRESGQNIDDLQLFDIDKLLSYTFYKRESNGKTKKKKGSSPIPMRFQDPLSIVYFLRSLPIESKADFLIPIMNKGKVLLLNARVDKKETIETEIGKREAFKIIASTKYEGDTLKSGDMTFWFSTDERRIFLKFKAEIKIGSISGDIEKYKTN